MRPRSDVVRLHWNPSGIAVADDPLSAAALPEGGIGTLHYATALDVPRPTLKDRQDLRAERRLRRAHPVLAYSDRVATWAGGTAIPAAIRIPAAPLPLVEQPVAVLVADWRWRPNQEALEHLLRAWTEVSVPGARLLLAGRGGRAVTAPGVAWLGEVGDVNEVLEQAAVLAFPCPGSSGPKVKVLEAAAAGVPVLTTGAGVEGIHDNNIEVTSLEGFGTALNRLLADPGRRAEQAIRARAGVAAVHGPGPAARARMEATQRLRGDQQGEQQSRQPG
jgi:glycosyltransferase involved in cell wall biosynthesis